MFVFYYILNNIKISRQDKTSPIKIETFPYFLFSKIVFYKIGIICYLTFWWRLPLKSCRSTDLCYSYVDIQMVVYFLKLICISKKLSVFKYNGIKWFIIFIYLYNNVKRILLIISICALRNVVRSWTVFAFQRSRLWGFFLLSFNKYFFCT